MADAAAAVIRTLGLREVDVLDFPLGEFQSQNLTRCHPDLVRKRMLLGIGPRGGQADSAPGVLERAPRPVSHMAQNIHNALLFIYPDADHAAQFQSYPERFLKHATQIFEE